MKDKRVILIISVWLFSIATVVNAQVTVTGSTGANGNYTSLTNASGAFLAINGTAQTGNTIVITITGNSTSEAGTNSLNAGTWAALTIYPTSTGLTISGSVNGPLINLNGASNITIDGRVNSTGSTRDLTISNTNGGATASTIRFINTAANNTVKYSNVKGSSTNASGGVIFFSSATTGVGNSNNTIDNCNLTNAGSRPYNIIYSSGSASFLNSSNTISNNNIYDFISAGANSFGINIGANSTIWNITGNSFYETTTIAPTGAFSYYNVYINNTTGNNFSVTGNYIGGSAPSCSGTWIINSAQAYIYFGIYLSVGTATASNIQNNKVSGISLTTSSGVSSAPGIFTAISILAGTVNVGTTSGNTIGATSGTGNISITTTTSLPYIAGIYATSTGTVSIQNNNIGSISTGGTVAIGYTFYGINTVGTAGNFTISGNNIGNATVNSIAMGTSGTTTAVTTIFGINNSATGTISITGNTIQNCSSFGSGTSVFTGIINTGITASLNMNSNTLASNTLAGTGIYTGISNTAAVTTTININNNIISSGTLSAATASGAVNIINNSGAGTGSTLTISSNSLSGISFAGATGGTGIFSGIYSSGTALNSTINSNNFNNLSLKTTGTIYLIYNQYSAPANGSKTVQGNYITTACARTAAGANAFYCYYDQGGSPGTISHDISGNTFSNIAINSSNTGGFNGIFSRDYSASNPSLTVYNNTISNVSCGTGNVNGIYLNGFGGTSISPNLVYGNTVSNISSASVAIKGLYIDSQVLYVNVYNNFINTISTTGAAQLYGIYLAGGTGISSYSNNINILSATAATTIWGLYATSTGTVSIQNNNISSVSTNGAASIIFKFYGINTAGAANYTISGNYIGDATANSIAMGTNGTTTAATDLWGIYNSATGAISITGNTVQNCSSFGSGASTFTGIYNGGATASLNMNGNTLASNTLAGTGVYTGISNAAVVTTTININNNIISSVTLSAATASGAVTILNNSSAGTASTLAISSNSISGITFTGATGGTGIFTGINSSGTTLNSTITANNFNNLSLKTTGNIFLINNTSNAPANGSKTVQGNYITTACARTAGGTGVFYCYNDQGSSPGGVSHTISGNTFSNITINSSNTGGFNGIFSKDYLAANNPSLTVYNNTISNVTCGTGAVNGIYLNGFSGTIVSPNLVYGNTINNISSASTAVMGLYIGAQGVYVNAYNNAINILSTTGVGSLYGIYLSGGTGINAYSNNINTLSSTGASTTISGIYVTGGTTNSVYRNQIYNLTSSGTAALAYGYYVNAGTTNNFYNNFISDIKTPASANDRAVAGIFLYAGTTNNVFYNTIYLNTSSTGTTFGSSGIYCNTTTVTNLRNNIIINVSTPGSSSGYTSALRFSSATLTNYASASNNNNLYAGTPGARNLIFHNGSSYQNIADFKALAAPRDAASHTENTSFINTVTTPYDLHIPAGTQTFCESNGAQITSPFAITDDFDGQPRYGETGYSGTGTAPDIGADEGDFAYLTPSTVSVSISADQCITSNQINSGTTVTFTATPTNGGANPSYQWKLNGNNVGTNSPVYSFIPAISDVVTSVMTSNLSYVTGNPATSNSISLAVNPHQQTHYVSTTGADNICSGSLSNPWLTIQYAINNSITGDTIIADEGTYDVGTNQILIYKSLTLRARSGLSSKPKITTAYTSYSYCAVRIAADNVVVDGFEIDGTQAFAGTFPSITSCYLIGDYTPSNIGYNNWTVKNCYLHHCREGVRLSKDNHVTIEGNEIAHTVKHCIDSYYSLSDGLKVTRNWLHSEHTDFGSSPAGISYLCDATAVNNVEISYNYVNSCTYFIDFESNGGAVPGNQILIMHNTVDWNLAPVTLPITTNVGQGMGISWAGTGTWTSSKFTIRDNIFTRLKYYAIVNSSGASGPLTGSLDISNNLFYQWYLRDLNFPSGQYPNEWPAPRGAAGWSTTDATPLFTNNIQADPLYKATGTSANEYYALSSGSPAHQTASDGTDIGAWQSTTIWTGAVSADWNTAGNWSGNLLPAGDASIVFDNAAIHDCRLDQDRSVTNITNAQSVYRMVTNGHKLTVKGNLNFTNGARIDASLTNSIIEFAGASAQTIPSGAFLSDIVDGLIVNNNYGITASGDFTVNGVLNLQSANPSATKGSLDMWDGSAIKTLTMGANATTIGIGDVTGIVKRTAFVASTEYTFGNQFTTMTIAAGGTMPIDISFKIGIGTAPSWKSSAVKRNYDIIHTGGSGTTVTVSLHYLDSELQSNTETNLVIWDYHPTETPIIIEQHGKANQSITDNWVAISNRNITYFDSFFNNHLWGLSNTEAPTFLWQGTPSSDWNDLNNWAGGIIPSDTSNVVIPNASTTLHDPVLPSSPAASVKTITLQSGGILDGGTATTLTMAGSAGAWMNMGTFNPGTSTVIFTHANATIADPTNFYNVTIAAGAGLTPESGNIMRIAGTLTNNGTLRAALLPNTIEFNGTNQTVINPNGLTPGYYNLILSGSGTKTMPGTALAVYGDFTLSGTVSAIAGAAMTIAGSVTIGDGSTFSTGATDHSIGGNFENNGTFAAGTECFITMNGSSAQSISGTAITTFDNLTIDNSLGVTLNANINVNNVLSLTSGNLLVGAATLGINGTVSKTSGYLEVSPLSSMSIGGTDAIILTTYLFASTPSLNNLTINRPGGVTLGNQNMRVNGLLGLTSGTLSLAANTLTIAGSSPTRTSSGFIDAGNASATLTFANTSAIILPASIFTGSVNNLTISGAGGVTSAGDFTIDGVLNLQSANPSATKGSLDMTDGSTIKTLTMGANATTTGAGDVTGIIKRTAFTANLPYSFGNQFTTATISSGGTYPAEIQLKISIGTSPSWKPAAINRIYEYIQTGGSGSFLTLATHYLDTELNGNNENELVMWGYGTPGPIPGLNEYGRSNNSTTDNWVAISNVNIGYFPTGFGQFENTFANSELDSYTWNGSRSNSWIDQDNWTPVGTPSSISDIIIPDASTTLHSPTINDNIIIKNLTIVSGAGLTINAGAALTVSGNLINIAGPSGLVILSSSGGDGELINNSPDVSATVELYLTGGLSNYHFFVPPVSTMAIGTSLQNVKDNLGVTNFNNDLMSYSESAAGTDKNKGWQYYNGYSGTTGFTYAPFSSLVSSKGYNIYLTADDKITFTGILNNSPHTFSLDRSVNSSGWNLVGNPYPCNYDLTGITSLMTDNNGVDKTVYFYHSGSYSYYNMTTSTGTGGSTNIVPPMQGFFVHVTAPGNSLSLPAGSKTSGVSSPRSKKAYIFEESPIKKIKLALSNSTVSDETIVCLIDNATSGFDGEYDAYKLFGSNPAVPDIYTDLGSIKYAINSVPVPGSGQVRIPVVVVIKTPGTYKIDITEFENLEGIKVVLRHGAIETILNKNASYSFSAVAGTFTDFELIIGGTATVIEKTVNERLKTWYSNNFLYINCPTDIAEGKSNLVIYDIQGKPVYNNNQLHLTPGQTIQLPITLAKGVYVTRIVFNNQPFVSKIVVL